MSPVEDMLEDIVDVVVQVLVPGAAPSLIWGRFLPHAVKFINLPCRIKVIKYDVLNRDCIEP